MAKKFFYVCAGLFLLAFAYHFGASSAGAQAPGNPIVGVTTDGGGGVFIALTSNGDAYSSGDRAHTWYRVGNVFGNSPTSAATQSWGQVKSTYRK